MIRHFKLLRNIGTFNSDTAAASLTLKQLNVIYGENGRGKTTLAAVLRSLATGDSMPISERHRLGSSNPPHVVLDCEGDPSTVIFQDDAWNRTLHDLKIFDDVFVDDNVHSGLDVDATHRQHLHELILGDQGVALNRCLQELVSRIGQHNKALLEMSKAIPEQARQGLSIEEFCALPLIPDVEAQMKRVQLELMAARNQDDIRSTSPFEMIQLPELDTDALRQTLRADLAELDHAAVASVQSHFTTLGDGGESWIADGMRRLKQNDELACPFCGQDLAGLALVEHYRVYFSKGYAALKEDISTLLNSIEHSHSEGAQLIFERAIATSKETRQFWSEYCNLPPLELDTEAIVDAWTAMRASILTQLKAKLAAPLERQELTTRSVASLQSYDLHKQKVNGLNQVLASSNALIADVKERSQLADTNEIRSRLLRLEATAARHSPELSPICDEYLQETKSKARTEIKRDEARSALNRYRATVFPSLQDGVNEYLQRFHAGFHVDSLAPANIGGGTGSTCTYNVVINDIPIAVKRADDTPGVPSFRNTMSSGDRNTLALALFFSSLDQTPHLEDTIVVIDDPMSSLDEHRSLTTVQEVRKLSRRVRQLIVLSHNKPFLCNVWNGVDALDRVAIGIHQNGEESTLQTWDVTRDMITEHDHRHMLLGQYADTGSNPTTEVAQAIRMHLEGFLRVACPGEFPPGRLLGQFKDMCRNRIGQSDEILTESMTQELEEIIEFANLFHHDTNPAWQSAAINATELLWFVRRTLAFTGLPK